MVEDTLVAHYSITAYGIMALIVFHQKDLLILARNFITGHGWGRLLDFADEIRQFIQEHDAELKRKER